MTISERLAADNPASATVDTAGAGSSDLSSMAATLAEHFRAEVETLSNLQFRLADESVSEPEVRRELSILLTNSRQGLAVARGFHTAIASVEANGAPLADALKDPETILMTMTAWLDESRATGDSVSLDLTVVSSLLDHVEGSPGPEQAIATSLIYHMLQDARAKLDRSRPPMFNPITTTEEETS